MNESLLLAFVATSLVLAVTPGPGVVYIVARTAAQGRPAGLASVGGVALGNLCNAVAASLGLAALFAASATVFAVVRLAGAAYLVYLGLRMLRPPDPAAQASAFGAADLPRIFRDGFAVALLNPKTALFFAALLPQFIDPSGSAALQGALLSVIFVGIALLTDTAYVLLAGVARQRLGDGAATRRLGRHAAAATLIGPGVFAALSGSRGAR